MCWPVTVLYMGRERGMRRIDKGRKLARKSDSPLLQMHVLMRNSIEAPTHLESLAAPALNAGCCLAFLVLCCA
jgi:hypothetical protein